MAWNLEFQKYKEAHPDLASELERRRNRVLPSNLYSLLPKYQPTDAAQATRKLSENVLNAIAESFPELIGGSADLTGSNLTHWKTAVDYQHPDTKLGKYEGRYIRFGVREHGMAAICNGIASTELLYPFCSTFLNFISYALGAVRLSCLSQFPVLYIMTHDSIGLGEDGPTHQPVETLASLRALPNLLTFRPADGNEVSGSYFAAFQNLTSPSVLCLSRQNVPQLPGSSIDQVTFGAYTLLETMQSAHITLVATGTEVSMALDASKVLQTFGISARVVSMPCCELFDRQSLEYKHQVFPKQLPILSIEALCVFGWQKYAHAHVGLEGFGTSGPYTEVYKFCGISVERVVEKAKKLIDFYKSSPVPDKFVQFQ
ncbi:Transketolase [Coelomomyces lativittatus]|nr:Transketolase [Coelomomyces lativittatus]